MSSSDRKLRRRREKEVEKDLAEKIALMGNLPNHCLMCETNFDRTNREHVSTWRVAVREKQKKVNLYCPECWDKAINMLEEIKKELEEKSVS